MAAFERRLTALGVLAGGDMQEEPAIKRVNVNGDRSALSRIAALVASAVAPAITTLLLPAARFVRSLLQTAGMEGTCSHHGVHGGVSDPVGEARIGFPPAVMVLGLGGQRAIRKHTALFHEPDAARHVAGLGKGGFELDPVGNQPDANLAGTLGPARGSGREV